MINTTARLPEQRAPRPHKPVGIFEPLSQEHDYILDDVDVKGALPNTLRGTLYRNGCGRWEAGGQPLAHLFDGDGMLSMFVLDGGKVRYRNRYVRTKHYQQSLHTSGPPIRGIGTLREGGLLPNAFRRPANVANTNVVLHAGKLLALWEGGKPHALDPNTLATNGQEGFGGRLRWTGAFSAHPKLDPRTHDLYNFGVEVFPRPKLRSYRLDSSGRLHHITDVPLARPAFNHDFALTERHLVFVLDPIEIPLRALPGVLFGRTSFDKALTFRRDQGTTIILVPRDGGKPRVLHMEAMMHFHVNNAYEDGTDMVVDIVRWDMEWADLNQRVLREFRTLEVARFGGSLTRLRISPTNRVSQEPLSAEVGEFPQYDQRLTGRAHRFSYLTTTAPGALATNAITKTDHMTGRESAHVFPDDHLASEPLFVPKAPNAGEDEGWLLSVVYDNSAHRSRLVVLDAEELERPPIYEGTLRHHVPLGFHGTFTTRVPDGSSVRS